MSSRKTRKRTMEIVMMSEPEIKVNVHVHMITRLRSDHSDNKSPSLSMS